jgi:serine phosphatase RsbU (regulator of sigma subunit)
VIATVCAVELPADHSSATFVNAGHPPALLLSGGEVAPMPLGGPPLGVELCDWTAVTVPLPSSWVLLLYTDGIIEARAEPGAQARIGIEGFASLFARSASTEAQTGPELRGLMSHVERMNGGPLPDDATLLALSRVNLGDGAH